MKNTIYQYVKEHTDAGLQSPNHAAALAQVLHISRNLASGYLNELCAQGRLVKINSRPVRFFDREKLEESGAFLAGQTVFSSREELCAVLSAGKKKNFEKLIGYNGSLSTAVTQCRAAVSYPPNGLPVLLNGETGTGKSMVARLMYEYAVDSGRLQKEAPYLAINCSEYANNPELLSANLFGHTRGAFTGAVKDNPGMLSLSAGGILFLDEVHCLSSECQEKLFLFMDQGRYHMVGDNKNWYESDARLIFATTKEPEKCLLKTLLRRIPVTVQIPSLNARSVKERVQLISYLLQEEEQQTGRRILISNSVYNLFVSGEFSGNIGDLKNALRASCANAFCRGQEETQLKLYMYDVPENITRALKRTSQVLQSENRASMVSREELQSFFSADREQIKLDNEILEAMRKLKGKQISREEFFDQSYRALEEYSNHIMFEKKDMRNAKVEMLQRILENVFAIIGMRYHFTILNNDIILFACYLKDYMKHNYELRNYCARYEAQVEELYQFAREHMLRELRVVEELADNVHGSMDLEMDRLILSVMAICFRKISVTVEQDYRAGVILAHGYSTASSIADSVNKLLGKHVLEAIDMPVHVSSYEVVGYLDTFLSQRKNLEELILLVDMGSLEEIYTHLNIKNIDLGIINNISTKVALCAAESMLENAPLEELFAKCMQHTGQYRIIHNRKKENMILCSCASGEGTAERLRQIFLSSIPKSVPVKVMTYDYATLVEYRLSNNFFRDYNVVCIIGTLSPGIEEAEFISIERLLAQDGLEVLGRFFARYLNRREIERLSRNIIKNFSLSSIVRNLNILDADRLLEHVAEAVDRMEAGRGGIFGNAVRYGLYVHICCMVERLMMGQGLGESGISVSQEERERIREALSGLEKSYRILVPDSELSYLWEYIENGMRSARSVEKEEDSVENI